jgi:hypothetical protein
MNERLMGTEPEEVLDSLVRAARADRPGSHSVQRAVVALGLGGATMHWSVAAGAAAHTASGAAATATAAGKSAGVGISILSIAKAAMLGVAAGGIALGTAASTGMLSPQPEAPSAAVSSAAPVRDRGRADEPARKSGDLAANEREAIGENENGQAAANENSAVAMPVARQAGAGANRPAAPATAGDPESTAAEAQQPGSEATLADEVRMLEAARSEISARRARAALDILERYGRQFPDGRLALEADVLRIESLFRSGKASTAMALADRFLAANPKSPLANRVRTMVRDAQGAAGAR